MPKRLHLSTLIVLTCLTGCGGFDQLAEFWQQYQQRFIAADGRVIDTGNGGISHSEGQGYAMLLAIAAKDRGQFERIWQWTRTNLQVRGDRLFMWRRRPGTPVAEEDPNNATDGDILIAWALLEAARAWREEALKAEAGAILDGLKRTVIRSWQGQAVLLPGAFGFETGNSLVLNLSYWVFPALQRFAEHDPDPVWPKLIDSGLALLRQSRFGTWQLPTDWVEAGETLQPWQRNQAIFGYNAVRIPLYLIWAGYTDRDLLAPYLRLWESFGTFLPAWIDLKANCMGAYQAPPGIRAVFALTRHAAGKGWWLRLPEPDTDYYSASLTLLSRLAAQRQP